MIASGYVYQSLFHTITILEINYILHNYTAVSLEIHFVADTKEQNRCIYCRND
jgi:hypothetical protein